MEVCSIKLRGADIITSGVAGRTPNLRLDQWNGECFIQVAAPLDGAPSADVHDKTKWRNPKAEVHLYTIEKRVHTEKDHRGRERRFAQIEDGSYELEYIFLERPDSNILEFHVDTRGLRFHYQPELTQKEIDHGAFRPENVVGSYAVYHESKKGDYSLLGGKNYRAGKAFHIYRPKVIDADGNEIWGVLNVDEKQGLLTVTIDRGWLDSAVYPVSVDPTFGRTDIGGSSGEFSPNALDGSWFACPEEGSITNIIAYIDESDQGVSACAAYKKSSSSLVGYTEEWPIEAFSVGWHTFNIAWGGLLSATDYNLVVWSSAGWYYYFDTVTDKGCGASESYDYPNFPFTPSFSTYNYHVSIYCTYSEVQGAILVAEDTNAGSPARRLYVYSGAWRYVALS